MFRAFAAISALSLMATPASACDCIRLDPKGPHFAADLDRIAAYYPVVAEGVLEPDGQYAWRFRPTREIRGHKQASYPIELISDCSLGPDELKAMIGKRIFVLLAGDGNRFEISRCVNFLGGEIEQQIRQRIARDCKPR
jgi:hypothetical protein